MPELRKKELLIIKMYMCMIVDGEIHLLCCVAAGYNWNSSAFQLSSSSSCNVGRWIIIALNLEFSLFTLQGTQLGFGESFRVKQGKKEEGEIACANLANAGRLGQAINVYVRRNGERGKKNRVFVKSPFSA
ncbi:hypothetical protein Ancab_027685 [Ancistrocladus abbreviatus]